MYYNMPSIQHFLHHNSLPYKDIYHLLMIESKVFYHSTLYNLYAIIKKLYYSPQLLQIHLPHPYIQFNKQIQNIHKQYQIKYSIEYHKIINNYC